MATQLTKPFILGIDPGISGALALIDHSNNNVYKVWDMPLTSAKSTSGKKSIDPIILANDLTVYAPDIALAVVEDVHAMPGNGSVSMFNFGVSKGLILGMIYMSKCPAFTVPPAVWKGVFGLSSNKDSSREMASQLYSESAHKWSRKKDDGRAEAVLLAHFGKRFL